MVGPWGQANGVRRAIAVHLPGAGAGGGHAGTDQAPKGKGLAGIVELALGPQHKHAQALECLRQEAALAHQKNRLRIGFDANKTGLHAPFGVAKRGQPGLVRP